MPPPIPPPPSALPPSFSGPPPLPASGTLESKIGLRWVNLIAVITLILGAGFFFKYAVDNNWIGPSARVVLGIVAAAAALITGDRLWHREQKIFAQGLTGLGLALLFLSFWATFGLYHLLPQSGAFALMVLATAASAVFALRYNAQAIAVLGLLGGYITPAALSSGENHPWILFSYVFLLNLGAIAAVRFRRWPVVEWVAFGMTVIYYGGWAATWLGPAWYTVATVAVIAFYAQFALAGSHIAWVLAHMLASIAVAGVWNTFVPVMRLEFVFALGGLAIADWKRWREAPAWSLVWYWAPYWLVYSNTPKDRPIGEMFALATGAFALFFAWSLWWTQVRKQRLRDTDLTTIAVNAAMYFGVAYSLLHVEYQAYMGLFAVALGAIHLLLARMLWKPGAIETQDSWPALLALAVTLTFLTLAVPIQFTGFRITIAWALEGAALAWLAARFASDRLWIGAWLVYALVLVRLFSFDAWIYADGKAYMGIVNQRFLTFFVSALALWLGAKFSKVRELASTSYILGHFVMLWILSTEVIGWAERSVTSGDIWSVETTAISLLLAVYAAALVLIGVTTRTSINRVLGLGLIGIVILKLYLIDVWTLRLVFRIAAFLGLGGLLLLVSYLYSRYKDVIERFWKDDAAA
jgi:uncharacterized membrane protein